MNNDRHRPSLLTMLPLSLSPSIAGHLILFADVHVNGSLNPMKLVFEEYLSFCED